MQLQFLRRSKWQRKRSTKWNRILWSERGNILCYEVFCKVKQLKTWCNKTMMTTCQFLVTILTKWWTLNPTIQWYVIKIIKAIDDLSDDEKDDFYIKDTDALIVAGKVVWHLIKIRKNNTPVLKFMSMNKREITCMFIMKSCFHLSHWIFNGLELISDPLDLMNIKREIMPLLVASCPKLNSGTLMFLKLLNLSLLWEGNFKAKVKNLKNSPTKAKSLKTEVTRTQSSVFHSTLPTSQFLLQHQLTAQ